MKIAALFVLAAASLVFSAPSGRNAAVSVSFNSQNVTLANSASFSYRNLEFVAENVNLGLVSWGGYLLVATATQASSSGGSGSGSLDVVAGCVYAGPTVPVTTWLGYFDAQDKWTSASGGANGNFFTLDVSGSGGLIGTAFSLLQEKDTSGNIVNTVHFSSLSFSASSTQTDSSGNLHYGTLTASNNGATYKFTVVGTSVYGQLDLGAIVTPKSAEIIVEIDNYPYANSANTLTLVYYVGYAIANFQGSGSVSGGVSLSAGSGPSSVYISNQGSAVINGNQVDISANIKVNTSIALANIPSSQLKTQLQAIASSSAKAALVTISFPAGASTIVYDPTSGFEQPQVTSSASVLLPSLTLLVVCVVGLFAKF